MTTQNTPDTPQIGWSDFEKVLLVVLRD